jgi:hypothetical protein
MATVFEDRGHFASQWLKGAPANEVDTPVVLAQEPGLQAMRDRPSAQAGTRELGSHDESLLGVRDSHDLSVAASDNLLWRPNRRRDRRFGR